MKLKYFNFLLITAILSEQVRFTNRRRLLFWRRQQEATLSSGKFSSWVCSALEVSVDSLWGKCRCVFVDSLS